MMFAFLNMNAQSNDVNQHSLYIEKWKRLDSLIAIQKTQYGYNHIDTNYVSPYNNYHNYYYNIPSRVLYVPNYGSYPYIRMY